MHARKFGAITVDVLARSSHLHVVYEHGDDYNQSLGIQEYPGGQL